MRTRRGAGTLSTLRSIALSVHSELTRQRPDGKSVFAVLDRGGFSRMSTDDRIDDADISRMWAKHFPKIGVDVGSKTVVLSLVYIIEDKARAGTASGDWLDRISQELRRYGIPSEQFWEIHSAASR